jgi:hypothetical protein
VLGSEDSASAPYRTPAAAHVISQERNDSDHPVREAGCRWPDNSGWVGVRWFEAGGLGLRAEVVAARGAYLAAVGEAACLWGIFCARVCPSRRVVVGAWVGLVGMRGARGGGTSAARRVATRVRALAMADSSALGAVRRGLGLECAWRCAPRLGACAALVAAAAPAEAERRGGQQPHQGARGRS